MKTKTLYWIFTTPLCLLMLFSAGMYIFNHAQVKESYMLLGYPTHLIYISAAAKILGVIAIISNKSNVLKEWAYAGFSYILILAVIAHIAVADGQYAGGIIGLVVLIPSYYFWKKGKN